jgi:hypothetical protein
MKAAVRADALPTVIAHLLISETVSMPFLEANLCKKTTEPAQL